MAVELHRVQRILNENEGTLLENGMQGSEVKPGERIKDVRFKDDTMAVDLVDGRTIIVPLVRYPKLLDATTEQPELADEWCWLRPALAGASRARTSADSCGYRQPLRNRLGSVSDCRRRVPIPSRASEQAVSEFCDGK
jgi:hypothetical protein